MDRTNPGQEDMLSQVRRKLHGDLAAQWQVPKPAIFAHFLFAFHCAQSPATGSWLCYLHSVFVVIGVSAQRMKTKEIEGV